MEITLETSGGYGSKPPSIIELVLTNNEGQFIEEITDANSMVSEELIEDLQDIVDYLKQHNQEQVIYK